MYIRGGKISEEDITEDELESVKKVAQSISKRSEVGETDPIEAQKMAGVTDRDLENVERVRRKLGLDKA